MTALIVKVVLAYLLGSVSGSLLLGRLKKVDIRSLGSGNAGGTNAFRTQGLVFALGVVVIDVGKGFLAAWWIPALASWRITGYCGFEAAHHGLRLGCRVGSLFSHLAWFSWWQGCGHRDRGAHRHRTLAVAATADHLADHPDHDRLRGPVHGARRIQPGTLGLGNE